VTTNKGRVFNGLVKLDTPDLLVLTVSATEEVRLPRADVDAVKPGKVSIMPAGLEKVLSPQEMADLVAFLKACQ
jgi:putative heme-binding domain-containing protein